MVENVTQRVTKLLLPFAVCAKDREEIFTKEMEMAAILCLAESERRKSEGFILKKPAEKLIFIAEVCYPLWLVPWRGRSLLFDGFGAISHTLTYDILPDIKTFINDLQGTAKRSGAYSAFLSDALNYFQGFKDQEEKTMEGLIASREFIQDFVSYIQEAKTIQRPILDKAFLTHTLDESTLSSFIQDFSNLRATLKEDIASLRESMRMLSATTREHIKTIRKGIKETRKVFNEKIEELRPSVLEKVQQIQKKYDDKIITFSKKFDKQLHHFHEERVKFEKTNKTIAVEIKHCETEIDSCKLRKDGTGETHWRKELEECKKRLSALAKEIVDADKKLEDAEAVKRIEISKIRSESNVKAEAAMKCLRELEASRDAKIQMDRQEIKSLEEATSAILNQIDKLIATKKAALNELEGMGIVQRRINYRLAYLPVYLACYQTNSKRRYVLHSPSVACSMRIKTKFKRFFGVAKIKSLLQQRSKFISSLLNELLIVVEHNPVFEREITDAGVKANILRTKDLRKRIRIGLERLRDEGWISENEFQTFSKLLTKA